MKTLLMDRLSRFVRETPEATAVVDEAGRITYSELERLSNIVAHLVLGRRRGANDFVAVMLPRTRFFLPACLGTLKAGAAFVVVSPSYPTDRILNILDEVNPIALLTTAELWDARRHELKVEERLVTTVEDLSTPGLNDSPVDECTPEQDAFVLYTSGTTGKPKGVVHGMGTPDSLVRDEGEATLSRPLRFATLADFSFIASIQNILRCLISGGELHLIGETLRMDLNRLVPYLNEHQIDSVFMGGSMGAAILSSPNELKIGELRLGGEKLPGIGAAAAARARVLNVYGMTELSALATHLVTGQEQTMPVGKAPAGVTLYVLDERMREVPAGTIGDIYGASDRMAKRYMGLPELSAERFVENPFRPGTRFVRTGDRGYWDENGELVICGRSDNMVKLRGQRIETGEVEVVAQTFPGVGVAVCVLKKIGGEDHLCLFFEQTGPVDRAALRNHLAHKLTPYMVPSALVPLGRLPRSDRGKINRSALPDPSADDIQLKMEPVASDYESILFTIASRMLGTDRFGVTDDLFTLGMSSLMAMKLVAEAEQEGVKIKASDLMTCRSIRATLQHATRILEWYAPYDPKKEVMVFVCGVTLTVDIPKKLALFAERYNVMTIEPVVEHYRYIFEGDDVDEIVEFYYALIDYFLPEGARLKALAGSSWGGKLAYLIAERWQRRRGEAPTAILGDTILGGDPSMAEALLNGTFYDWLAERGLDKAAFNSDFVRRQTALARIESKHLPVPTYAGPVILIHALDHWVFPPENDKKWMKLASNLTILPVDANHNEISMDTPKGLPFWRKAVELS